MSLKNSEKQLSITDRKGKEMSKKTRNILIAVISCIVLVGVGTYVIFSSVKEFDAKGYVKAILDKTIKGETKEAAALLEGVTEESMKAQYDAEMKSFTKQIIEGAEMDEETEARYTELCKKIFASMKYEVVDVKKTEDENYEVTVKYQSVDVFTRFIETVDEEGARLHDKVEKGEYQGSEINRDDQVAEMDAQLKQDYIANAYTLLEQYYNEMQFGEEQTMIFVVEKNADGKYSMKAEQIKEFVGKISALNEFLY